MPFNLPTVRWYAVDGIGFEVAAAGDL